MPDVDTVAILVLGSGEAGKHLPGRWPGRAIARPWLSGDGWAARVTLLRNAIFTHPAIAEGLVFLLDHAESRKGK